MYKIMLKKHQLFLLSQLQRINIDNRKIFYNAHLKPHISYVSVVWDDCGKVHFKKVISRHQKACKFFLPCLLYTSPSPRDQLSSRMPSSA